ncbi:sodium:solute symporter [Pseudomonas sp. 02C 26]|uniref:sodium:solute symporter n=1 Tax=Pseudomonas sp. 02C 26 TaxID=2054914 RepID=UPI000C6CA647|nr:sodium:solute symporter [Pseudomonas sp. 02C 26]AUF96855.1 sodium:solute symporter [Pseudomonas sp. 02C 26]
MSLDVAAIAIYGLGMLLLGWYGMRRATSTEDYLVAGRNLGPSMYMGTMAATVLGGASTIGTIRLGYEYGIAGLWICAAMGFGILVLNFALAKHLLNLKLMTVNQVLEKRFNRFARRASAIIMFSYAMMICVVSFLAIGTVAQVIFELPGWVAILVGSLIVIIYSTLGGMWSLTLTDMIQFLIKTIGLIFVLLPVCLMKAGNWEGLQAKLPETYFSLSSLGWEKITTYFIIYFFGILIGQDIWQRVFTARSVNVAKYAGMMAGLYCFVYGLAGAVIGMCAKVLFPDIANTSTVFATAVEHTLPAGLRGLVIAAALSAMMSTASAGLLASSTLLTEDLLPKLKARGRDSLMISKAMTLAVGSIACAVALCVTDVLDALTIAYNFLVGGMLIPLIAAIYWKRATTPGAVSSMLSGFVTVMLVMWWDGVDSNSAIYWSLAVSGVSMVLISLATSKPQLARPEGDLARR